MGSAALESWMRTPEATGMHCSATSKPIQATSRPAAAERMNRMILEVEIQELGHAARLADGKQQQRNGQQNADRQAAARALQACLALGQRAAAQRLVGIRQQQHDGGAAG